MKLREELIEAIKNEIINKEGIIISSGTLRTEDLLSSIYSFILCRTQDDSDREQVLDVIASYFTGDPTSFNVYYGKVDIKDDEEAFSFLHEEVDALMQELVPDGFYYGSSYGDGACIGFFLVDEDEEVDSYYACEDDITPEEVYSEQQQELIDLYRRER